MRRLILKNNKIITNSFAMISVIGILYCFIAYIYIQTMLTPMLAEPTETINTLGGVTLIAFLAVGLYHCFLLIDALKALVEKEKSTFLHSLYIVLIILSGITLLSDITILSDIGKEYKFWDVNEQWLILYGCTVVHLVVVIYGFVFSRKNKTTNKRLFEEIRSGNDVMFLSLNQVILICGLLGIAGAVFSMSGLVDTVITKRYEVAYMLLLACLALVPLALFAIYWFIRNRNKPLSDWFDEKQISDTASGALISFMIVLPLIVIFTIVSIFVANLQAPFWLLLVFFIQLITLSGIVLSRNRIPA